MTPTTVETAEGHVGELRELLRWTGKSTCRTGSSGGSENLT
jgi:hypothetical protein